MSDLLKNVLAVCVPGETGRIRLMATDVSKTGMTNQWAVVPVSGRWARPVRTAFARYVDRDTLRTLLRNRHVIIDHLAGECCRAHAEVGMARDRCDTSGNARSGARFAFIGGI
jgi:hypothetical protein